MRLFQKRIGETRAEVGLKDRGERHHNYDDPRLGRKRSNRTDNAATNPGKQHWHPKHRGNDQYYIMTPFSIEVDDYKKKESFTELVRKLNCAAPKKEEIDVQQQLYRARTETIILPRQKRTQPWVPHVVPLRKGRSLSDITRPVIVTVKDGEVEERAPFDEHKMAELKSSFIIGEMPTKVGSGHPFHVGMSARHTHYDKLKNINSSRRIDNQNTSNYGVGREGSRNRSIRVSGPKPDSIRTASEIARRERWRRGLEMEQRMWKEGHGNADDEDDGDGSTLSDYRTQGSHTTGRSGEYSSVGPDTLTTATDTDDSTDSDDVRYRQGGKVPSGHFGVASPPSCREYAVKGVAEDIGIVAGLLLSDGGACLGVAAAITRETVANCREGKI